MTHKEQLINILESAGFKRVENVENHREYFISRNKIVARCIFYRVVYEFDNEGKCTNISIC